MSTRTQQQAAKRAAARQAAAQAQARRQRTIRITVVAAVLVAAAGTLGLTLTLGDDNADSGSTATSDGLLVGPPPWPAQAAGLQERIADLEFPPGGDESYHAHAQLSVYRNGEKVTVPANIGFDTRGTHSSLHTHTPDGVIHMEADDPYPYTLSEFFTVWGVAFGDNKLGGDVSQGDQEIFVFVNGKPAPSGEVRLEDGDNIVVAYGTADSFPKKPPTDPLDNA